MINEELSKLYHYMCTWVDIYRKNINEHNWFENEYDGMFYLLKKDKWGDWICENAGMVNLKDKIYNYTNYKQGLNETGTKFFMHFDTFDKNELKYQVDRQVKEFKQILKLENIENDFV